MSIQPRQSLIAMGSLIVAALALAACGGGSGNNADQASPAPTATTSPPAAKADPLEGEWRAEFTCQESVRAIERRLSAKQIREQLVSWKAFLEPWGAEPTKDDPCHGAIGTVALLARFADGNLALLNAETGEGAQARYDLVGAHAISVDESEGALCGPCPTRWKFEIAGDKVSFRVGPDMNAIGAWEAAPFERVK